MKSLSDSEGFCQVRGKRETQLEAERLLSLVPHCEDGAAPLYLCSGPARCPHPSGGMGLTDQDRAVRTGGYSDGLHFQVTSR